MEYHNAPFLTSKGNYLHIHSLKCLSSSSVGCKVVVPEAVSVPDAVSVPIAVPVSDAVSVPDAVPTKLLTSGMDPMFVPRIALATVK